jgi:hypothetical protein
VTRVAGLLGLLLQVLHRAGLRAGQPLHVAQGLALHRLDRVVGGLGAHVLVARPVLGRHARGLVLEQGLEHARRLRFADRVVAGQHAVEHPAHFGVSSTFRPRSDL